MCIFAMARWDASWPPCGPDLEANLAVNNRDDVAADPDVVAVPAQVDAAGALQRGALRRDVRRLGEPGTDQPLGEARVEAARDRILVSAAADERAYLERGVVTRFLRAHHAELERIQRDPIRLERKHLTGGAQHHRAPSGAVVDPLVVDDVGRLQSERPSDLCLNLRLERARAAHRWCRELEA